MSGDEEEEKIPIKKVKKYIRSILSEKRYEHSLRTAKMCRKLCALYGLDEEKGFFAGISHDMCKEMARESLLSLAEKDGQDILEIEREKPSLLHGRAAAVLLEEKFNCFDKDVIEAVAHHTFGKKGMGGLAKVLYVADKIEPGREHITNSYLERLYQMPLDVLVKTVLQENRAYLHKKGRKVAPASEELLKSLCETVVVGGER